MGQVCARYVSYNSCIFLYVDLPNKADLELLRTGLIFDVEKRPRSLAGGSKLRMTVTYIDSDADEECPVFFDLFHSQIVFSDSLDAKGTAGAERSNFLHLESSGIGGLSEPIESINAELAYLSSADFPASDSHLLGPTSFLLHGSEGLGKTLLLERLAAAPWRKVYRLDHKWLAANRREQAEALSEDVFRAATKNQPSLIVIDNLDKFLQKAEDLVVDLQSELKKIQNTKVVVAAATRKIYDINANLLSRLGLRIKLELFPPNVQQREDILRQILGRTSNLDLTLLAERCHGFVGRDIDELCSLARYHRQKQVKASLGDGPAGTLNETLANTDFVTQDDFEAVVSQIQPTVLKESILEVPKVKWSDIAGVDHVRELLESIVVRPYKVRL